ncbi:MAG TPA: NADPH:quinone oxidoreductase family protein [Acetobacteraceae bacterium]|nr:NADPH:quinone oxidoreductase family protein [Acetobacteraceae bacterium]
MRAVVCESFGGPEVLAVRELPDPAPPGAGELQIRLRARGVQYVDVLQLAGTYQVRPEPPFVPGSEAAGEVVSVGAGVTRFKPGDAVMSRHRTGAWATLANAPQDACDPVPSGMDRDAAAVLRSGHGTAYHALLQRGRLHAGEWVLVHGAAGGIGIAAIQIARLAGARVIATASTDAKRAACLAEGAEHALDYRGGFVERVKALTGGRGVDIVYDPIGAAVTEESLRCLAYGGRLLILGFLGGGPASLRSNYLLIKGIEAVGVYMGGFQANQPELFAANAQSLLQLAAERKIEPRISHRFTLEQAAEAVQAVMDRAVIGKAVLVG